MAPAVAQSAICGDFSFARPSFVDVSSAGPVRLGADVVRTDCFKRESHWTRWESGSSLLPRSPAVEAWIAQRCRHKLRSWQRDPKLDMRPRRLD